MADSFESVWATFWHPIMAEAERKGMHEPGYDVNAHIVSNAVMEQIKKELFDYHTLLDYVPKVYDEVTDGRISKPNTTADAVIGVYQERLQEAINEALVEVIEYLRNEDQDVKFAATTRGDISDELIEWFGIEMPKKETT